MTAMELATLGAAAAALINLIVLARRANHRRQVHSAVSGRLRRYCQTRRRPQ
jgi:hypothetical protein